MLCGLLDRCSLDGFHAVHGYGSTLLRVFCGLSSSFFHNDGRVGVSGIVLRLLIVGVRLRIWFLG